LWAKVEAKVEVKGGIKTPMFPGEKHRQNTDKVGEKHPGPKQVKNRFLSRGAKDRPGSGGDPKKGALQRMEGGKNGVLF
jgi:hypothetical protein